MSKEQTIKYYENLKDSLMDHYRDYLDTLTYEEIDDIIENGWFTNLECKQDRYIKEVKELINCKL